MASMTARGSWGSWQLSGCTPSPCSPDPYGNIPALSLVCLEAPFLQRWVPRPFARKHNQRQAVLEAAPVSVGCRSKDDGGLRAPGCAPGVDPSPLQWQPWARECTGTMRPVDLLDSADHSQQPGLRRLPLQLCPMSPPRLGLGSPSPHLLHAQAAATGCLPPPCHLPCHLSVTLP